MPNNVDRHHDFLLTTKASRYTMNVFFDFTDLAHRHRMNKTANHVSNNSSKIVIDIDEGSVFKFAIACPQIKHALQISIKPSNIIH